MEAEDGIRSHYHAMTAEGTAVLEDLVHTVLNFSVCEIATAV